MTITLTESSFYGVGNHLYPVIRVDHDDPEDTSVEHWWAENEEDLVDQLLKNQLDWYKIGEDDPYRGEFIESFKQDVGYSIIIESPIAHKQ